MPSETAALPVRLEAHRALVGPKLRRNGFRALLYLLLAAGAAAMLFPFAWMISTSLKPDLAGFATPPQLIPKPFAPENYSKVVHLVPVWRYLINIVGVAVLSTGVLVGATVVAAYAFPRRKL